jgi:hypothetical protein
MKNKHRLFTKQLEKPFIKKSKALCKTENFPKWVNEPVDEEV